MNAVLETIQNRRSFGKLITPAPKDAEVKAALQAALAAPDHKQLKPWQFSILKGKTLKDFGKVLENAAKAQAEQKGEKLDAATNKKNREMPLRAPMIITVATKFTPHEKVPPFEQLLSAGAAAQNLILALESMGYHTIWRTGPLANTPEVRKFLNVGNDDAVCGFIYVGSSKVEMPEREAVKVDDFIYKV
ncbi:nitroreductase [Moraxella caviae]|uniref:Putative NAD(P)H nitroreductase n=1 Tax=Moraxella caviae TaxID=34060 RepID=A0A1T0A2X2_9GAMM|nr:nitroreductase family protein [Moraxella caviae]OOR90035.1 nitroreductase [Moraxella caviae]STZ14635.1 Putative NAD(P)H nitroreductase ydjA [Moraxella caviae]VEW11404.1 Putative NAD(P)H nitroreductase ydjA [Moraxella caviae]